MKHFYDAQIRRYLTQVVRLFSNFTYKDGKGNITTVPVIYGDLTRQVGNIIRDNSENKIPTAPRMSVYVTGLEMDRTRTSDSSYVSKLNIRERAYNSSGAEYLNTEGKNYTVERLMPTPYNLTVNLDIWSTNTDQKLQIMEQILMLFNPSLEIQTTDNYVDWTSLSVVNLDNINWSSRTIPAGTESEIDVSTLTFQSPIYISPPAKVKKLGVITNIITAVFADNGLEINVDDSALAESIVRESLEVNDDGELVTDIQNGRREVLGGETTLVTTSHNNYDLIFLDGVAKLLGKGTVGAESWTGYIKALPEVFENGITKLRLQRRDGFGDILGTVSINTIDETELIVNIDPDTLPTDTLITSSVSTRSNIDYIIDPTKSNPENLKVTGVRILLLNGIGNVYRIRFTAETTLFAYDTGIPFYEVTDKKVRINGVEVSTSNLNTDSTVDNYNIKFSNIVNVGDDVEIELFLDADGPDAWKNSNGTDFAARANDIVEWDGSKWQVIFNSAVATETVFTTNLKTGTQYKFENGEWVLSFEGEYPDGTWKLEF